ncbi:hypothetical protein JCM4814A_56180 [Streptomyces phaeofaciens JCM 4814]|uniref:Uncharacterized protein n=1 Tax=Streptomyces phaeofaciens TaxID=68254 RepID=A0A918HSU0_9ACTN|nr:hypothetical protein GCM10010226_87590 [Streptomyces phaeofaciens]
MDQAGVLAVEQGAQPVEIESGRVVGAHAWLLRTGERDSPNDADRSVCSPVAAPNVIRATLGRRLPGQKHGEP